MGQEKKIIVQLERIASTEREQWIIDYLLSKLKLLLMIDLDEHLPQNQNYFELGITSLQLQEFKQEIECDLDKTVNIEVFFNNPTINDLVAHLRNVTLKDYFTKEKDDMSDCRNLSAEESYTTNSPEFIFNNLDDSVLDEKDILERALNSLGVNDY
jgi:acyl carrier protein